MFYILFLLYLLLFGWIISKIKFFRIPGIPGKLIFGLFVLKVLASCLYGWLHQYFYPYPDTWLFHEEGLKEYHLLFSDTRSYFSNIFENNYSEGLSRVMDSADSFWNDLRTNLIIKILSVFNIFSGGNYYINCILFNFLTLAGPFYLYKVYRHIYPHKPRLVFLTIFLVPTFLFYSSGIHRDGLILLGMGMIFYHVYFALTGNGFGWKNYLAVLLGIFILFLFRNFVLLTLLPSLVAWLICQNKKKYALHIFLAMYVFFVIAFFNLGYLNAKLDLPKYVSERQIAFLQLKGNSAMELHPLYPNFRSFMNNAPQAFNHTLMRPYITEINNPVQAPVALEIIALEVLFGLFIFFPERRYKVQPFIYFSVFFALSMFLLIGYTIPFLGAIARYRSIYLPLLVVPLACNTDWQALKSYFKYRNY